MDSLYCKKGFQLSVHILLCVECDLVYATPGPQAAPPRDSDHPVPVVKPQPVQLAPVTAPVPGPGVALVQDLQHVHPAPRPHSDLLRRPLGMIVVAISTLPPETRDSDTPGTYSPAHQSVNHSPPNPP